MTHFVPVSHQCYLAAHRFGIVSGLGGRVRRLGQMAEFVTPGGEVLCRKLESADGRHEHWLRADLAEAAAESLVREQADYERCAAEVVLWSRAKDQARADEQDLSLEAFRQKRNAILARIDQRRGVGSRGMR